MIVTLKFHAPKKKSKCLGMFPWMNKKQKNNICIKKRACAKIDHTQETTLWKQWRQLWIPMLDQESNKSIKKFPTKIHIWDFPTKSHKAIR
jgi:hypothetical protein